MDDVAHLAGVSASTVSHVLNGTRYVAPETRRRVEDAIADIGYRRDAMGRALALGRTETIGVALSASNNPYFVRLINAIETRLYRAGYVPYFLDTHDDTVVEAGVVDSLLSRRVEGMILAPAAATKPSDIQRVIDQGTPVVLVDRKAPVSCDQVYPESENAALLLTRHLIELGHRRIALVRGADGFSTTTERVKGYRRALEEAGIPLDKRLICDGGSITDAAEAAVTALFRRPGHPEAAVVMNNAMTIGTLRAMRKLGIRVPEDVALVAYDDFEWSDVFEPRLTAVAQDIERTADLAVSAVLDRIGGDRQPPRPMAVPTEFHHRNSCGCNTN